MNIYSYTFTAECPNNLGQFVEYTLIMETDAMIMAEDLKKACEFGLPLFHECIADRLFDEFKGRQMISADHGGVGITTIRE